MDLSKIPEIVAFVFLFVFFFFFFFFFFFDKTSAINERVETTGPGGHRHFGVGQNRLLL